MEGAGSLDTPTSATFPVGRTRRVASSKVAGGQCRRASHIRAVENLTRGSRAPPTRGAGSLLGCRCVLRCGAEENPAHPADLRLQSGGTAESASTIPREHRKQPWCGWLEPVRGGIKPGVSGDARTLLERLVLHDDQHLQVGNLHLFLSLDRENADRTQSTADQLFLVKDRFLVEDTIAGLPERDVPCSSTNGGTPSATKDW